MIQHKGFTLVELMVALVLGLFLTAAALQLFITGSLTFTNQKNLSDIQDNATFGLSLISQQLRRTNSGNAQIIGGSGVLNGLVFSGTSVSTTAPSNFPVTAKDVNVSSTVDGKSDQLVIQYSALQDNMRDCEGNLIDTSIDSIVIERYFLRVDTLDSANPLALACAAFRSKDLSNPTKAGSVILNRVDDLYILIGTSDSAGAWRYYNIGAYNALATKPVIRSVRLATLIRSTDVDGVTKSIPHAASYTFLDQTVSVASPNDGFVRRVFSATVSFRNSLGDGV